MNVVRAERFETDVHRHFRWYLLKSGLDTITAAELADQFAEAVENTLDFLGRNPEIGRPRFMRMHGLPGVRSWRVEKPFTRFLIFYRFEDSTVWVERLLEGHSQLAGMK
jgi:toxin ParE1/3/4